MIHPIMALVAFVGLVLLYYTIKTGWMKSSIKWIAVLLTFGVLLDSVVTVIVMAQQS